MKKLKIGEKSKETRMYTCSKCGLVRVLTANETAPACDVCSSKGLKNAWIPEKKILFVRRDIKAEFLAKRSFSDKLSDWITAFCGNMWFVYVHVVWFALWILINVNIFPGLRPFDPFPFGLLTLVVSLEAILLATFILISQNRQGEISEMRSELDYQTDKNTEKKTIEILEQVRDIYEVVKKRKK